MLFIPSIHHFSTKELDDSLTIKQKQKPCTKQEIEHRTTVKIKDLQPHYREKGLC